MLRMVCCVQFLVGCTALSAQPIPHETELRNELEKLNAAVNSAPDDAVLRAKRAALYAALDDPLHAIGDLSRALELAGPTASLYDARGSEYFKLGRIQDSIADFDRAIEVNPEEESGHWKRGISYYYAGRWDDGRRQFEGYQTVDDNDVENAVWRLLCMARKTDITAARKDMLKIRRDPRIPMMEIYELYAGRSEPADVLAATESGSPTEEELNTRLFYAHLYLGLYFEVVGNAELASKHLRLACSHRIGHYMWNVADVHTKRLKLNDGSSGGRLGR
jgi:lipoprotein NlpI